MSQWDGEELTLPEVACAESAESHASFALTILYHPDSTRLGERAVLPGLVDGGCAELGRTVPVFGAPGGSARGLALGDPYLSRMPLEITVADGVLQLRVAAGSSSITVDGAAVCGRCEIALNSARAGVVLTLSHRVVLLLHSVAPSPPATNDCGMVGENSALQQARFLAQRVALSTEPVLLLGESGTGKELLAAAIHGHSSRAGKPLVTINMGAVPPDLAAAELFGVRRGAFTGADADRQGFFALAEGGTLFLDEVGACARDVQSQLLRAIQQGEIQSPGGGLRRVDVRVVAATDADIASADSFSKALRYRLGGFEIQLPALRERREDLGLLLAHFLPAGFLPGDSAAAGDVAGWAMLIQQMALYSWPGNVRELRNFCQQLVIAGDYRAAPTVPANVSEALQADRRQRQQLSAESSQPGVRELSDRNIEEAMQASRWEISRAARALGISRQALYRRLQSIPQLRVVADIPSTEIETMYHACEGELEQAALQMQVSLAALRRRWRALDLMPRV